MSSEQNAIRAKSALSGKWQALGKWAMVRGQWTCAKFLVSGKEMYVLFDADKRIGEFATFDAARRAAAEERKAA